MGTEVIGRDHRRVDAWEKVTGEARFIADIGFPGILHAKVFRSGEAHARIKRLDVSGAREAPGVHAVVTGEDCPKHIGFAVTDQWPIARDKVRFYGEPVAVVIADTPKRAKEALKLIEVEYEPLPPLLNPYDAVKPGAPRIHEESEGYARISEMNPEHDRNVSHHYRLRRGDVEKAFAKAHLVVENEFEVPWISHAQMETHGAIAWWDRSKKSVQIWASTQAPFVVRNCISYMYDLSPSGVRITVPYLGGGFGGKSDVTIEPMMAVAARAVPGRPVRLVLDREEAFTGTVVGRGGWGRIKLAVDKEGMLLAEETEIYIAGGGYADYSVWVARAAGYNSTGPYYIPNLRLDSYNVYTNTVPVGAFRGYSHPETHWMVERTMDIIARELGMDPVELRLKNLLGPGKVNAMGQTLKEYNGRPDECVRRVAAALEASTAPKTRDGGRYVRGQGIAALMKSPVMANNAQSGALIRFNDDGTANVLTGAIEMGQGVNTVMTQIAAESLKMPVEMVHYHPVVDTEYSPYEWQTVASHTTWGVGRAVKMAGEDAVRQIKEAASKVFGMPVEEIDASDAKVYPRGEPKRAVPYAKIVLGYVDESGAALNLPVMGRATFAPEGLGNPDPETGQGNLAASWTFGAQGAEIEVDTITGEIHVLRLVTALDAGRIINPTLARGQVTGAMIQALGEILSEHIVYSPEGVLRNENLTDYKVPTLEDIPEMEVIFVETDDEVGPYGARGLAEHPTVAIGPAVANALYDAIGIDLFKMPILADDVVRAQVEKMEKEEE